MSDVRSIDINTLCNWLETGKPVSVVDVRPVQERAEWFIPQSIHLDAYNKLKIKAEGALSGLHLDKGVPVVTVCAAGKTSVIAAELLKKNGFDVYSLKDGMRGWSLAWNKAIVRFRDYQIIQLRRTGKGCLSYIIASENKVIIVDASLPVDVYLTILKENNWQLTAVMETHIHADHLSRSKSLAEELDIPLFLPVPNKVSFSYEELRNDQLIELGKIAIKVISTPGHTLESICFLINDEVLLSGDTIFTNAVGRPDLKATNDEAKQKSELLYESLQKILQLGDEIIILPAHTNAPVDFNSKPVMATVGEVKKEVRLLKLEKTDFVKAILDKLPLAPANHLAIVEINLLGNMPDINPIDLEAGANRCAVV